MSKVKISKVGLEVLDALSIISNSMIINKDLLYVKLPNEEQKGISNIIGEYKLQEGDIDTENEIGIYSIPELLKNIKSCDSESLDLELIGNTLKIKDNRKTITYYTQSVDSLPVKNPAGDELYKNGTTTIAFVLQEVEIEKIKKDLGLIQANKISLKNKENDLYIVAENDTTSNSIEILVDKQYVQVATKDFLFPTSQVFDAIMTDNYKCVVKEVTHGNSTLQIMKLESMSTEGLTYTLVSVD